MATRVGEFLRKRDWGHLGTELLVVLIGVFLGLEFSNWNDTRREKAEIDRLLVQLETELEILTGFDDDIDQYYATTDQYAEKALAAWANDPQVSDREFVISAMQASQIVGNGSDVGNWGAIFGNDLIRGIEDDTLRESMVRMLTYDLSGQEWTGLRSDYRRTVRGIIPFDIQLDIHANCGDEIETTRIASLPTSCEIDFDDLRMAKTADALRERPELGEMLLWHMDDTRNYRFNNRLYAEARQEVLDALRDHNSR